MNLAEFFIKIGVTGDGAVKSLNSSIDGVRKTVIGLQVALIGSAIAINKFVSGTVDKATAMENFTKQTNLSTDELNKWVAAGQKANKELTFDTIKNNVISLQRELEQIKIGQGNSSPFQMLGLDSVGVNAFQVLDQLRDRIKDLSNSQAVNLIQQLGLDPKFIDVLRLSNSEFSKLSNNIALNKSQIKSLSNLGRAINDIKIKIQALKDQAVAKLAPGFMQLLISFQKWTDRNSQKIINTFKDIAEFVGKIGIAITRVAGLIMDFGEKLGAKNGLTTLIVLVGALTLSFRPLLLLMTALFLILEDIAVWRMGGDSLFGDLYNTIDNLISKIKEMPDIAKLLGGAGLIAFLATVTTGMGKMGGVAKSLSKSLLIIGGISAIISGMGEKGEENKPSVGNSVGKILKNTLLGLIVNPAAGAAAGLVTAGLEIEKYQQGRFGEWQKQASKLDFTALDIPSQKGITNNNKIDMYINGDSAQSIGDKVVDSLEDAIFFESQLR